MWKKLSPAARTHVVSLGVACVGFLVLLVAGVPELQPFPPGVPVLLVAALAVLVFPRRRWVPLIGVVLCLVIAFGAFVVYEGTLIRLADPGAVVLFLGTVLQMGGVIAAIVAGAVAALAPGRSRARQA
ncbi:MAG TPA: hypothetical protein VNP37_19120 [Actinomycetospora sp.]|nr:hypothetical protein [Actinomycetospora sp.]